MTLYDYIHSAPSAAMRRERLAFYGRTLHDYPDAIWTAIGPITYDVAVKEGRIAQAPTHDDR